MSSRKILAIFLCFLSFQGLKAQVRVRLMPEETFQTIQGFGASGAWSNLLINRWNDTERERVADWLFSCEQPTDSTCRGIGLSVWRFNLGAGSTEQGDKSLIGDPFRRAECFLDSGGKYNFDKQAGDQWMLRAAALSGVNTITLFVNSPPVSLTRNGKAFAAVCGTCNLDPQQYESYTDYLMQSILHFRKQGIDIDYISPFNEPEWGWCQRDGQEGCPYTTQEIAAITRILNRKLVEQGLETRIQLPESGLLLFANSGYHFKPGRQNEINAFFHLRKKTYVGDLPKVAPQVCAHSYFSEWPLPAARMIRKKICRLTHRREIEYWMTEYCILKKTREIEGGGRDLGMHTALYVARVMHMDLVYGNASSWQWWLGMSVADYKDGLVYANRDGSGITDSKTLWMIGNFSRFVHPGAMRIGIDSNRKKDLLLSAYRNQDGSLVLVVINRSKEKQVLQLDNVAPAAVSAWETSAARNLVKTGIFRSSDPLPVNAASITTFVFEKR
ncbi:MAG: glycoside hydrolase family 30 protein [Bacteroidales bacterium]